MAIVDSLLKLVAVRAADALVLQSGEVPTLTQGGRDLALTMPVPGADVMGAILNEITSAAERQRLSDEQRIRTRYRTADERTFAADITLVGPDRYRFVFTPAVGDATRPETRVPSPAGATVETATPPARSPKARPDAARSPKARPDAARSAPFHSGTANPNAVRAAAPQPSGQPQPAATKNTTHPLDQLLAEAEAQHASDVLISSGAPVRVRVAGRLRMLSSHGKFSAHGELSAETILSYFGASMSDVHRKALTEAGSCDLAMTSKSGIRYRANLFRQERGIAVALRPIVATAPTLAELNLPTDLQQLTRHRSGLVLMVGTAGSGKSTTLAALIEGLNHSADKHIITLEDPIEYLYAPQRCLIHQREVGRHVADFNTGLRAALRESPDVILLGEMRDYETIASALTAAETGHLVLSTLHSGSAAMAVDRIIDVFPQHQQQQVRYQLASVLRAVITQHLLPSLRPGERVPAYEKLEVTRAVATKIRDNRTHQIETELQKGRNEGMVPLELSLARLVRRRLLAMDVALSMAADADYLAQLIDSP